LATVATDRTSSLLHVVSTANAQVSGYQRAFQISAAVTFVALLATFALPRLTGRASLPQSV